MINDLAGDGTEGEAEGRKREGDVEFTARLAEGCFRIERKRPRSLRELRESDVKASGDLPP